MLAHDRKQGFKGYMSFNKTLQADKAKLSRLLHSQESRQLAFAAELGR
jgi:hypothetical protein